MNAFPKDFKFVLQEKLLELIWNQWCILGVQGNGSKKSSYCIDLESLILFTCMLGRREPRLFDEMVDWLNLSTNYLNIQRLQSLKKSGLFTGEHILDAIASSLPKLRLNIGSITSIQVDEPLFYFKDGNPMVSFGEDDAVFKRHGLLRGPLILRGYSQLFDPCNPSSLILCLRGLFGVSARCEILLYLITHQNPITVNPTQLAKEIIFAQKTVHSVMIGMSQSGFVQRNVSGRETTYSLRPELRSSLLLNVSKAPLWLNWTNIYSFLESVFLKIFEQGFDSTEPLLQVLELRNIIKEYNPVLNKSGLKNSIFSEGPADQSAFWDWFTRTILKIVKELSE